MIRRIFLKSLIVLVLVSLSRIHSTNAYFTDSGLSSGNTFIATDWTPPNSFVLDLSSPQNSLSFSLDYFTEDEVSEVEEVQLYYRYNFGSWRLFAIDTSLALSFLFQAQEGDGFYDFKTVAKDAVGNIEDEDGFGFPDSEEILADPEILPPDVSILVDTQKPVTMLSLGEFGENRFSTQEILANGNFEDTANPAQGWTFGGNGDHKVVSDENVRGDYAALIGFKDTDPLATAQDFLFQNINLPADEGSATLSFWYRLKTEDILTFDWFHVFLLHPLTNSVLTHIAHDGLEIFPSQVTDLGWKEVSQSLADFPGQEVKLYFEVENKGDEFYKTWAYIDDVRITKGINYVSSTAPISFSSSDASGSGVAKIEYKIDMEEWQDYNSPVEVATEGPHLISYRASDSAGLVEEAKTFSFTASPSGSFLGVVLNKISPRPSGSDQGTAGPPLDGEWVELYNNAASSIDVNGWVLYEGSGGALKIESSRTNTGGTILNPGGTLVIYREGDSDFSLNDAGDSLKLYTHYPSSGGVLVDSYNFGQTGADDKIWQRTPAGTGTWSDPREVVSAATSATSSAALTPEPTLISELLITPPASPLPIPESSPSASPGATPNPSSLQATPEVSPTPLEFSSPQINETPKPFEEEPTLSPEPANPLNHEPTSTPGGQSGN